MFNRTRAACQAFARVTLGRRHRIWSEISDVPAFGKIAPRRDKQPVLPSELDRICAAITDHRARRGSAPERVITAADLRDMLWTLATTGMGEKEYWRDGWEDRETYVHVHGVKRAQRDRIVPRVITPVRPACWPGLMRRVLATASETALGVVVQPYDLRRSFSQWLEHAGIERTHVRLYMGHGERTMTDVYLWRELLKFVEGDSATLAVWIERNRATAKAKAAAADAATGLRVIK